MLCLFLKWEECSRVPTVSNSIQRSGSGGLPYPSLAFSLHLFRIFLEVWASLNSESLTRSRSLKLQDLGGGVLKVDLSVCEEGLSPCPGSDFNQDDPDPDRDGDRGSSLETICGRASHTALHDGCQGFVLPWAPSPAILIQRVMPLPVARAPYFENHCPKRWRPGCRR